MEQVDGHVARSVLGAGAWEGAAGDTCIVDQDVEPAVLRRKIVISGLVAGGAGDVELEHVGIDAGSAQFGHGFFALLEVAGADDDFSVGGFQFEGSLETEAAVSAGDECNFLRHRGTVLLSCVGFVGLR